MCCDEFIRAASFPHIHFVPVCHYRLEFAHTVRRAFQKIRPQAVAVEYPYSLRRPILAAVERFPYLSVICYTIKNHKIAYIPMEPSDALCEAVRLSVENEIPCRFMDLDLDEYPLIFEPVPDSYALGRIGLKTYLSLYKNALRTEYDEMREKNMAYHLRKLAEGGKKVLAVCGMAHIEGILRELENPQVQLLGKSGKRDVKLYNLHKDSIREICGEIPFLTAVYEMERSGKNLTVPSSEERILPFPGKINRREKTGPPAAEILPFGNGALFSRTFTFQTSEDRRSDILRFLSSLCRENFRTDRGIWNRQKLLFHLIFRAAQYYQANTGERISGHSLKLMAKFLRNYALASGALVADLYQMIAGAKGIADDNFAYEVWDLGTYYPFQDQSGALKTAKLSAEEIWRCSKTVHFDRKYPQLRQLQIKKILKKRTAEKKPGEWSDDFRGNLLCSYPPEDLAIEAYGAYLKKKTLHSANEQLTTTEPFSTSFLDGIDMRETLRHMEKRKIYVKNTGRTRHRAGAVIVIFDEDLQNEKYVWKMTWQGEHEQESDMAFYATPMADKIVGPGIARCEYGGFFLSYPPMRLHEIWTDPFYLEAETKAELLLMAAIEYSLEKYVVYIAAKPPRSKWKSFAAKLGKALVYMPIGQFSPVVLKKLRVFHVLSGADKRDKAADYIW